MAEAAAGDPAVQWRVILTSPAGQAIAVTGIPGVAGPGRAGPGLGTAIRARRRDWSAGSP